MKMLVIPIIKQIEILEKANMVQKLHIFCRSYQWERKDFRKERLFYKTNTISDWFH